MPTATCHCRAVRLEVDGPPSYLNECHCSICRRYGVHWGYYPPGEVAIEAATGVNGNLFEPADLASVPLHRSAGPS